MGGSGRGGLGRGGGAGGRGPVGGGGVRVEGGCERRIEVFVKIIILFLFFFG